MNRLSTRLAFRIAVVAALCLVVSASAVLLMLAGTQTVSAQESPLHPTFPLLDSSGENVLDSGAPISTLATCGSCHDAAFISSHDMHADLWATRAEAPEWDPVRYGELPVQGDEINCFLCHRTDANNEARVAALAAGEIGWANTATLLDSGIVTASDGGYRYNAEAFDTDGRLLPDFTQIQDPNSNACGSCHGQVHTDNRESLALSVCESDQWRTFTTGQVVSPQRISAGGANVENKETLTYAWDIHAERVLNCVDCHYGVNNPVFADNVPASQPEHLQFDPRRLDFGEYLERPSHLLANGSDGSPACENCHDSTTVHTFLPYEERHTEALACESCHIPQMNAAALAARDWTTVDASGEPLDTCRGISEDGFTAPPTDASATLISGYQPVLLQDINADGSSSLSPYNLITVSYWEDANGQPVPLETLRAAYLEGDTYASDVLAAFDSNGDGSLSDGERTLDSESKSALIAQRLAALGVDTPQMVADVVPYSIHHGVVGGEYATRECQSCHSDDSRVTTALPLASPPGGITPRLTNNPGVAWNGSVTVDASGLLSFQPETKTDAARLYLFGRDSVEIIDQIGVLLLLGVAFAVTVHATLRVISGRRRAQQGLAQHPALKREYMYSIYERQWHWLQTAVIFGLIFTGLVIHRPQWFSIFSFAWMVDIHNVLALILVINAALALFYHLASGEIKQFIPRPYGFFDQMISQALFYLRGIFRGDPHPFEKTASSKMNPLQQMTYLMILNVLLPLQILTGALMWGAQQVPALTNLLGGLPILAPFHTLIAWLFATFIVAHVYLTTTGHEPLAGIKAMIGGYDEVETHSDSQPDMAVGSAD